jgi:hypothetical protein
MARPASSNQPASPGHSEHDGQASQSKAIYAVLVVLIIETTYLLWLGTYHPFFIGFVLLNTSLSALLLRLVRFNLEGAPRALLWTGVTAAVSPIVIYLLLLAADRLRVSSDGVFWFGLFGTYGVSLLASARQAR